MSRELFSVSENKPIGGSWSRDSLGRLDSIYFYSGVDGRDENLFQFHQKNLDKKRDREWEADRESRIFQLEEIMRMRDSNETEVSEEQIGEGNVEDPFVPEIEIPSMINTVPTTPDSSAEPDPFAPMDPSPVESSPEESPFAPTRDPMIGKISTVLSILAIGVSIYCLIFLNGKITEFEGNTEK